VLAGVPFRWHHVCYSVYYLGRTNTQPMLPPHRTVLAEMPFRIVGVSHDCVALPVWELSATP